MVSKTAGKVYGKRGHQASERKVLSMEEVVFDLALSIIFQYPDNAVFSVRFIDCFL